MATSGRIIFLTGAPQAGSLNWDEDHLLSNFEAPHTSFLDGSWKVATTRGSFGMTPSFPTAKWRCLEYNGPGQEHLATHENQVSPTQFLSFSNYPGEENDEHRHLEFFDHSATVLEGLDSSQILPNTTERKENDNSELHTTFISNIAYATTASTTETSFQTSTSSHPEPSPPKASIANISCPTTDLKRIPNAQHITRIQPQTITLNLLVGIISISAPRTVHLRRNHSTMDIVELTVGDDTRAGFSISFWLVPVESQRKPSDDLRELLRRLRTGDVVLLRNVALSCFRGCVFGQSLSRRFARNSTSIVVLEDGDDPENEDGVFAAKARRVRDWTGDFVAVERTRSGGEKIGRAGGKRKRDDLPPDTQD